jgi:DNA-binding NarL/FixJ family response regulator
MSKPEALPVAKPARVFIVDDHPLVREGLTALFAGQPDLEVCGEADDLAPALDLVKAKKPDVVVVDVSLKSGSGIDLIKQLKARDADCKILVSSMYDESLYAERALRAGAMGYINKQEMPQKVLDAVRQVLDGKMYLSPAMTDRMLHRAVRRDDTPASPVSALSDRELEIFQLVGRGQTTRQIANALHLSVKTVESHRENIKTKLNLTNSAELVRQAVQWVLGNG